MTQTPKNKPLKILGLVCQDIKRKRHKTELIIPNIRKANRAGKPRKRFAGKKASACRRFINRGGNMTGWRWLIQNAFKKLRNGLKR